MAGKEPDKLQREIEELLGKLDTFVPEERLAAKIRTRRRQQQKADQTGPTVWERLTRPFTRITLGQVMIAGLICLGVSFFFRGPLGEWAGWLTIAGLVMTAAAFILSMVSGGGSRTTIGATRVQKRWRGQVIEYGGEPSTIERFRAWLRRKGKR